MSPHTLFRLRSRQSGIIVIVSAANPERFVFTRAWTSSNTSSLPRSDGSAGLRLSKIDPFAAVAGNQFFQQGAVDWIHGTHAAIGQQVVQWLVGEIFELGVG